MNGLSVIIPLRVPDLHSVDGLQTCMRQLLTGEIIVVDQSNEAVYTEIDRWFTESTFVHLRVDPRYRDLPNQKMAAVLTGLDVARGDRFCIFDDDFRPRPEDIDRIAAALERADCVTCDVCYREWTWAAISSTCTRFIKSVCTWIYDEGYEPAHVCFTRRALETSGPPPADILFDDLAILRHFRRAGFPSHRLRDAALEKRPPDIRKFWEQRFRYAYEELAYPWMFSLYLVSLPAALLFPTFALLMALLATCAALWGWLASARREPFALWAVAYAPIWYWLTAVFVWTVPFTWLRGGCRFGGRRIRRVV